MSAITIENDLVHYEVLGRGRPVILLHGWLGSWRYWIPAMQQLSAKYRVYGLDLWGFGDTGKDPKRYDFRSQVLLLDQFMEKMGITKAALVGHDLGAALAVQYATWHTDRVPRLLTICPPLFRIAPGSETILPPPTAPQLPPPDTKNRPAVHTEAETIIKPTDEMKARIRAALDAKQPGNEGRSPAVPPALRNAATPPSDQTVTEVQAAPAPGTTAPPVSSGAQSGEVQRANPLKEHLGTLDRMALLEKHVDSGPDRDKLRAEVEKADPLVLSESISSFAGVDTLRALRQLTMPNVALYGVNDTFTPPPDATMIATLADSACHIISMDGIRHFPMLENVAGFNRLLVDFLEIPNVKELKIKEQWERRVR
jgi:pimeloyl-ACP methyl ester carboxylesterase